MRIGVPKEIKNHEYRVGMTPPAVRELTSRGHEVFVETNAGEGIGLHDELYERVGAKILKSADEVFGTTDMIVKVKEPQPVEIKRLRPGQVLFTYLHLAPDPEQTRGLLDSGVVGIAYETVTDARGGLPLLAPMSEVAGRMSIQAGAHCLEIAQGGRGQLLGGVPGVPAAKVVVLGGGVVGTNAARMAMGLEAHVIILDVSLARLKELDEQFGSRMHTLYSTIDAIEEQVVSADLVIGGVLLPGAAAPKLITRNMVSQMKKGSVIVDVAIDQGGCAETSHPTTHADPTYVVDDVVHYCVANMPGAVARTSTFALNNATLPFTIALAEQGAEAAMRRNPHLRAGLNVYKHSLTYKAVGDAQKLPSKDAEDIIGM
ncbi:MAG: alanine dehydrogenase [Alphaproteobacteria bacterium]|nr:alanine dehydrogenase [Alphaproteobacteria bacterium]MBL6938026.1 alanine dehydrogenase [Alphaproteobacteria bacterium]MBL7099149.1 alanine dehydrogenase [Alphaproteobacteria bacterium]